MKFNRPNDDEVSINLTPLIDIVFLLLIFFIVSTTFSRETTLRIRLPDASVEPTKADERPLLVITITARGEYSVRAPSAQRGTHLLSQERAILKGAMIEAARGEENPVVVIRADRQTPHESVVRAMDVARSLGLTRITFSTQQPRDSS